MQAVIVSLNYGDILARTLPRNRRFFDKVIVVTARHDVATVRAAEESGAQVHLTRCFWRNGARFNKFRAMEEGLAIQGRTGWVAILDADIVWPSVIPQYFKALRRGYLHSLDGRYIWMGKPSEELPEEAEWPYLPQELGNGPDGSAPHSECIGYTQIFHCSDPVLESRPWHPLNLPNAAKGDSDFQARWDLANKVWLPCKALHLGPIGKHWDGRKV